MHIGFIGFGGAAYGLAKGLKSEGFSGIISCFDASWQTEPQGGVIRKRAEEIDVQLCASLRAMIDPADIVISSVTGGAAVSVAEQAVDWLTERHLYVDVNTASPRTMEAVFKAVDRSGARFVDVAMMGGIPSFLHRVPCLASGNGAELFIEAMRPYNMNIRSVGQAPGQASAIKLFRSIFMKGLLALLLETLNASRQYGVDELILESLAHTMNTHDFLETVRLQLCKGAVNAARMTHEMESVVETLLEAGLPCFMSEASRQTLNWCSELRLDHHFAGDIPESLEEVMNALVSQGATRP